MAGRHGQRHRLELARTLGISERRLLGWEPEERHEHFDVEGNLTGWTVITRESEWDASERNRMLALDFYEAQLCIGCGFHESVTSDPSNLVIPERHLCTVCAGKAQYERLVADEDKKAENRIPETVPPQFPRPADGRRIVFRHLSPPEAEAEQERRRKGGG